MSLADVRPYFRSHLDALGYVEHRDIFNYLNIPGNLLDTRYHLSTDSISSGAADQQVYTFGMEVTVRLFKVSFNDTVSKHEELIVDIERTLSALLNLTDRTTTTLFDVIPGGTTIEPIGATNDNWQVAVMPFTAVVKQCY